MSGGADNSARDGVSDCDRGLPAFARCILEPFVHGGGERSVHSARVWLPFDILAHNTREIPEVIRRRTETAAYSLGDCIDMVIDALGAIEMDENPVHWCWRHLINDARLIEQDGCVWIEGDEPRLRGGSYRVTLPVLALHPVKRWVITLHGFSWLPEGEIDTPIDQETLDAGEPPPQRAGGL